MRNHGATDDEVADSDLDLASDLIEANNALRAENARLAGLIRDAGEVVAAAGMAAWPCRCLSTAGKGDEHPCVPCKARLVLDAAKEAKS